MIGSDKRFDPVSFAAETGVAWCDVSAKGHAGTVRVRAGRAAVNIGP